MCGIAGYIKKYGEIDLDLFNQMVDMIDYRGPDDRGVYINENIALGHRRLSIIDISKDGHQPFLYNNRYVVVYNGEIYNYIELRDKLEKIGYKFNTKTDTEVLVAAYVEYGCNCVNLFNGMWGFAIYDIKRNILFCSRDRYGVKPFYYSFRKEVFIFGSEIKQVLFALKEPAKVNKIKLQRYLFSGELDSDDKTMFDGVYQLSPGCNLLFDINTHKMEINQYYDIGNVIKEKELCTYEETCELFRELFEDSVRLRQRSDVKIGYCLSGGLDSSANVCVGHKVDSAATQECITSCSEYKEYDEQEYADEVVRNTRCQIHKIYPSVNNLFEELDDLIWHMDEPFGSTSIFASRCVFKKGHEVGLKVMLDGQGSDEQLAGYTYWYQTFFISLLRRLKICTYKKEVKLYINRRSATEQYIPYRDIALVPIIKAYVPECILKAIRFLRKNQYKYIEFIPKNDRFEVCKKQKICKKGLTYDRLYLLQSMNNLRSLLHYEDRNTMAYSIESRLPFLDYRLVNLICRMPIDYKIRNGMTKAVLRDSLKEILPEKVRERVSKLGFVTPEDKWIEDNKHIFDIEIEKSCDVLKSLVDKDKILEWWKSTNGNIERGDEFPWRLICAAHWVKVFNVEI